ncbi:MAG: DinB family protein [Planctomycetaceae bacterium]
MSRSLGNIIADSLQLSLNYAERLLKEVSAEQFARLAAPGGQVVQSNHPAFVYGHLSLYGSRIVEQLGGDAAPLAPSAQILTRCSEDAQCQDDPQGSIYPPMSEITTAFFNGYKAAMTTLRAAPDEALQSPNPAGGRMAELFPTIGSVQTFYCGGHIMMHLGQISAWRRMQGLPPA